MASHHSSVGGLIHEIGRAWNHLRTYPEGHPALAGSVDRAHRELAILVAPTGVLELGVDKESLVCAEEVLSGPNARRLAGELYRRNVALVRFHEGVEARELRIWLRLLRDDPTIKRTARLWDEATESGVERIEMVPVDLSAVETTDSLEALPWDEVQPKNLWRRILDELVGGRSVGGRAGGGTGGERGEASLGDVVEVVHELLGIETPSDEGGGATGSIASDPVSDGPADLHAPRRAAHLAEQLAAALGAHLQGKENRSTADLEHTAQLVRALPAALRPRVLDAAMSRLATEDGEPKGVELLAATTSGAALVGSLRRLRGEELTFSETSLRLVEALAFETGGDAGVATPSDPEASAAALRRFLSAEDVDAVAPDGGTGDRLLLEVPPVTAPFDDLPTEVGELRQSLTELVQSRTLAHTLLELLAITASPKAAGRVIERLESVLATLLGGGQLELADEIVRQLESLAASGRKGPQERAGLALERFASPRVVGSLVDYLGQGPDDEQLKELVLRLGDPLIRSLLLALAEEDDLGRRRRIFNFVESLGDSVVPEAVRFLGDDRWFVVRNVVVLLRDLGDRTSVPKIRACLAHDNPKVRLEAVKSLATLDPDLPSDLADRAIADPDPKVSEAATSLLGDRAEAGLDTLVELLKKWDPTGQDRGRRLKAFRVLGAAGNPEVLPHLKRYFNPHLAPDPLVERRAAFASLAGYPDDARRPWLEKGLRSRDAEIRTICERLLAKGKA